MPPPGPPTFVSTIAGGGSKALLAGLRVGVTAGRRGDELASALARLGADVVWAPTVELVPGPSERLRTETAAVLASRPDWVVVTTGEGLTRWVESTGVSERKALLGLLGQARVAARGAKAVAACRRYGVATVVSAPTERGSTLVRLVADLAAPGATVVCQVAGRGSPDVVGGLRAAGLVVREVAPYRWELPVPSTDLSEGNQPRLPACDLVRAVCDGALDVVVFTSPPAVDGFFAAAASIGQGDRLPDALSGRVLVAAVGPATAETLEAKGVAVGLCPLQPRIGALVNALVGAPLNRQPPLVLDRATRSVAGQGGAVGLSDLQFALLVSLARRLGMVCPTSVLLREVWGDGGRLSGPAARRRLEVLASRLRARLADIEVSLTTVPKRGYRLEAAGGPRRSFS